MPRGNSPYIRENRATRTWSIYAKIDDKGNPDINGTFKVIARVNDFYEARQIRENAALGVIDTTKYPEDQREGGSRNVWTDFPRQRKM